MPAATPVMTPVKKLAVALAVVPLVQLPPPVALVSVVVVPGQTVIVPVLVTGRGFTVTVPVALQPVGNI